MSLRFDYKMFLNVLLYALKKTFEGQWPEYNWSKYSGAMERPIKVNRHKGGGVDIYFCSSVGRNVLGGLVSNPVRAWIFLSLLFCCWLNCSSPARIMPFFDFTSAAPKKSIFLQTHSLNLRKEENLCFDSMLFVNYSSVINKISLFDLNMCSQSGRDAVAMFVLSFPCMRKSPNWLFFPNNC